MAGKKLASAYYELIAATPNAEGQITAAIVPGAQKAGAKGGSAAGSSMGSNLSAAVKKFAAPVASALSVAGIAKFAKASVGQFTEVAGSVKSLQRVIGGTPEQVSSLQGAMKLSGMEASKANGSLTIFSKKLQAVSGDSKKTAAMQKELGTSLTDANGKMKPMSELLPQVADTFKNMPDGVQKTALATSLFGKSGTAMLPFLNQGSSGIKDLEGKAKSLGITLNDGAMDKWAKYKTAVRGVQTTMDGLKTQVGNALIPIFTGFSNFIINTVTPTIKDLIKWFQSKAVQDFANKAGQALSDFGKKAADILKQVKDKLMDIVTWVMQNKDWLSAFAVGIGVIIAAFEGWKLAQAALTTATKIATAVQTAFNIVMDANPVAIVIIAIAALAAGLIYFFTQTKTGKKMWSDFTKWLKDTWNSIKDFFQKLWNKISGFFSSAGTKVQNAWNKVTSWFKSIPGKISGFFSSVGNKIGGFFTSAGNKVRNTWNGVSNWFKSIPGRITGFFSGVGGRIGGFFSGAATGVKNTWNNVVGWFKSIPGKITGAFSNAGSWLKNAGSSIINGFWNGLKSMWDKVTGWISGIGDWITQHKGPPSYDAVMLTPAGSLIMQGFAKGLTKGWNSNVEPYVSGLNSQLQSSFADPKVGLGSFSTNLASRGSGYSPTFNIHTNDANLVAAVVSERERRLMRQYPVS